MRVVIGIIAWVISAISLFYEPIAINASTAHYDIRVQPMSDLGVTTCGVYPHPLAPYEVCSPHYFVVNVLFVLSGVAYLIGIIVIDRYVKMRLGFWLFVLFAIGTSVSGLIPADVHFNGHTIPALGMMFVPFVLFLYVRRFSVGRKWTYIVLGLLLLLLAGFILVFFMPIPVGILQRVFYGLISLWGLVYLVLLHKEEKINFMSMTPHNRT